MTAQTGISMLLKLGAAGAGGTIAGFKAHSLKLSNETVDVTTKDSAGFRTLLAGAGTRSLSITGNGIVESAATYETFQANAMSNTFGTYYLVFGDGDSIEGTFQPTDFEIGGEFNGEQTFSVTLASSGAWTFNGV